MKPANTPRKDDAKSASAAPETSPADDAHPPGNGEYVDPLTRELGRVPTWEERTERMLAAAKRLGCLRTTPPPLPPKRTPEEHAAMVAKTERLRESIRKDLKGWRFNTVQFFRDLRDGRMKEDSAYWRPPGENLLESRKGATTMKAKHETEPAAPPPAGDDRPSRNGEYVDPLTRELGRVPTWEERLKRVHAAAERMGYGRNPSPPPPKRTPEEHAALVAKTERLRESIRKDLKGWRFNTVQFFRDLRDGRMKEDSAYWRPPENAGD